MPYVVSSGVKIYYEVVGEKGKPYLMMLHGNGNSVKNWHGLGYVEALRENFNLILLDCRGYGNSDKPHDSAMYTPELITQDCISVLDVLGIDKVHVYGGSRGANIVLLLAKYFPERFLSYIAFDSEVYGDMATQGFCELLKANKEKGMQAVVEGIEEWLGKRFPESIRDDYIANDIDAMIAASSMRCLDLSGRLSHANAPCCLIASQSEPWCEQMPRYARENPAFELNYFETLSHADLYWGADVITPIITNFIKKVSANV